MTTQQPGQWSGYWTWQPATHQWTWTWTHQQQPGGQVSGYGVFGQPDAAGAEATQVRQLLTTLTEVGQPTDGQQPDRYSIEELNQIEAGLRQALAGVAQLREQITAG